MCIPLPVTLISIWCKNISVKDAMMDVLPYQGRIVNCRFDNNHEPLWHVRVVPLLPQYLLTNQHHCVNYR